MAGRKNWEVIRWYFTLALIETFSALLWLLLIPAELPSGANSVLTARRIVFVFPLLMFGMLFSWLAWFFRLSNPRAEAWSHRISSQAAKDWVYWLAIILAGIASLVGAYILIVGLRTVDPFIKSYALRLAPYALWVLIVSFQTLIAVRLLRFGASLKVFGAYRSAFRAALVTLTVLVLLSLWILYTRIGLIPDETGWGQPGVPLLPYQVSLALLTTLILLAVGALARHLWCSLVRKPNLHLSHTALDALICLLLWLGAVWRWSAEPLKPVYFAPRPVEPNNEFYPYSDAALYDLSAQRLLVGSGFEQNVIRPIYSLFLALAQGVSGIGYASVVAWQVPVLAVIPALLFLLAKALHHRLTGLLVGLLAIVHESNSLAFIGIIDVSNSKLMMSDLPITLGMILLCLIVVQWLKDVDKNRLHPFLAGGVIGIFMLIRTQFILLMPVVLVLAWFPYRKQPRRWLKSTLVLMAGLIITLAPWLWRNWSLTGEKLLADTQAGGIIYRYASLVPDLGPRLSGETLEAYRSRIEQETARYLIEHPEVAARVFAGHYWNNHLATLMVLPSSYPVLFDLQIVPQDSAYPGLYWLSFKDQCCSLKNYVKSSPFWFKDGQVSFTWDTAIPLIASMLLFSIGAGATWSRTRMVSLVPLSIGVFYGLGSALARLSGWRYNLPVDWVGILYYSAGLMQACFWVAMFFRDRVIPPGWESGPEVQSVAGMAEARFPWKSAALAGMGFFLLTASLPVTERMIPNRYQAMTASSALASLEADGLLQSAGVDRMVVERLLEGEAAEALIGRALYPRYYKAGKGLLGGGWPAYEPRDFNRLGFVLTSPATPVVLPVETAPSPFPNASDVLVIGCKQPEHVEALMVAILNDPQVVFVRQPLDSWSCTTP